jgi:hypothetical protein
MAKNWGDYFSESFLNTRELGLRRQQLEEEKAKSDLELYLKSQPSTYTYTDPATGEAKSYSVQSGMPQDIVTALEEKVMGRLKKDKGKVFPPSNLPPVTEVIPPDNLSSTPMGMSGGLPPNIATFNQGGKTQIIKNPLGSKDTPAQIAQKNLSGTGRFLEQFGRSYNELKTAYPEIGDVGFTGWATRGMGKVATALDNFPETKAFRVEKAPLANQMARDVEGGRVTDQDRKIYADSFADVLEHPTQTNIRLVSNKLLGLKDKGGNILNHVAELYSSDIDIMQNIALETLKSSPDIKKEVLMRVYQNNPDRFEVVK